MIKIRVLKVEVGVFKDIMYISCIFFMFCGYEFGILYRFLF